MNLDPEFGYVPADCYAAMFKDDHGALDIHDALPRHHARADELRRLNRRRRERCAWIALGILAALATIAAGLAWAIN